MKRLLPVCFVFLLVGMATVAVVSTAGLAPVTAETATDSPDLMQTEDEFEDSQIGCVNGVCHDDELDIDQSDGLDDEELELFVSQSMARVEYIRDRPFREDVGVDVMTREEYRSQQSNSSDEEGNEFNRWNDQVWKGLMIIGESTNSEEEISDTLGSSVAGFYSPSRDEIVIITPDTDNVTIDDGTLVHEHVHAMQDQYYDLTDERYRGETQDEDLAIDGIVEGEAGYIEQRYEERCGVEWTCHNPPSSGGGGGGGDLNLGVFVTIFHPYSDGPGYVHAIVEREGWDGVDDRMENPPESTTQVTHQTDREPASIDFTDEATDDWETYPEQGVDGADTVGEASIYAMFYYQSREYGAGVVDPNEFANGADAPYVRFNYVSAPSEGWANDKLYPYRRGDDENGYVWVTEWETEEDATEFSEAYLSILTADAHNGTVRDDGIYVLSEDSEFSGAYGVHVTGTTVEIVHGPSPAAIEQLRPSTADAIAEQADDEQPTDTNTSEDAAGDTDDSDPANTTDDAEDDSVPGFGPVVAIVAIVSAALLARRQ